MAHKTKVGGTAYEITGGAVKVGGTKYSIKKGRTKVGGTGYDIPFSSIVPIGELPVGTSVFAKVNGVLTEHIIVHQGIPSSLYDSSCNGTWLLLKDSYTSKQWTTETTTAFYNEAAVHTYLKSTFPGLYDTAMQAAIKTVRIPYCTSMSGNVSSGSNGLSTKAFLLSGYEVGWTKNQYSSLPVDGACLSYFSGLPVTDSKRIAKYNGNAAVWALRSLEVNEYGLIVRVSASGGVAGMAMGTGSWPVRPAIIVNSTTLVNGKDYTIIG